MAGSIPGTSIRNQFPEKENECGNPPVSPARSIEPQWCHHPGLLIFSGVLEEIAGEAGEHPFGSLFRQLLAQLLAGAVNIEQSKLLNSRHLRMLTGHAYKDLSTQRMALGNAAARPDSILHCLRVNARLIRAREQRDFYLDPHTKNYTGTKNLLKGWVSSLSRVGKAIHSDYIHTADGFPLYFDTTDNYLDLRERIFSFIEQFRDDLQYPESTPLTFVIDRGIHGMDTYEQFITPENRHLITWEKNYKTGDWDEASGPHGSFQILRSRNHSRDLRTWRFSWQDSRWIKDERMRRLIVRAVNPKNEIIEVGVLTDDRKRPAKEVIQLIFNRWIQENDFKYLDQHFGINQITSYKSVTYEQIKSDLEDKQITSARYKSLQKDHRSQTGKLKDLLHKRDRTERMQKQRREETEMLKNEIEEIEKLVRNGADSDTETARRTEIKRRLSALKTQVSRAETNLAKWNEQIDLQYKKLEGLEEERATVEKETSRLETLIANHAERMQGANKRLLDALRILARNAFYVLSEPFRESYDNLRDDHVIFRSLTHAGGIIEADSESVRVGLLPEPDYPQHQRRLLKQYLAELTANGLRFPDGSGRRLTLKLTPESGIEIGHKNEVKQGNR